MIRGGLKIFGVNQKGIPAESKKKPKTLGEGAKKVFGKWHGFGAKIKQHGKGFGNFTKEKALIIIRFFITCKMREAHEKNAFANKTGKKSESPEEKRATGSIYQDAEGWFNSCGRPRYPQ